MSIYITIGVVHEAYMNKCICMCCKITIHRVANNTHLLIRLSNLFMRGSDFGFAVTLLFHLPVKVPQKVTYVIHILSVQLVRLCYVVSVMPLVDDTRRARDSLTSQTEVAAFVFHVNLT